MSTQGKYHKERNKSIVLEKYPTSINLRLGANMRFYENIMTVIIICVIGYATHKFYI